MFSAVDARLTSTSVTDCAVCRAIEDVRRRFESQVAESTTWRQWKPSSFRCCAWPHSGECYPAALVLAKHPLLRRNRLSWRRLQRSIGRSVQSLDAQILGLPGHQRKMPNAERPLKAGMNAGPFEGSCVVLSEQETWIKIVLKAQWSRPRVK